MSLEAAHVKEELDAIADEVVIKEEESEPDCVEVPYVAIEAAIVDVEFEPPVKEDLHSIGLSELAEYMDCVEDEQELIIQDDLNPECVNDMALLEADMVSQYADVKEELILEPESIQRPNTVLTSLPREKCNPVLTDCWVRIERCQAAEKALKKHMAELYVKENRVHTLMTGDEDFFCEGCKQNEIFEFCKMCNINMRALTQLRNLRGKRLKTLFTCGICCEQFQEINKLYQHRFLIHGIMEILQMKNPTEFYSTYLSRVYSEKTIGSGGSTSNLLNTTNVNTEKLIPIEYNENNVREVMTTKIGDDVIQHLVLKPENMLPRLDYARKRKPYNCKVCNKPATKEKLCDECVKERVNLLSNVRVENNFLDNKAVLRIKRPPHLPKKKHQMSFKKQPKLRPKTRECFVRLERCEAAEEALITTPNSEIVAKNTIIFLSKSNLISDNSEEHFCNMCQTITRGGAKFCEACEKEQAENLLMALKMGNYNYKK